MDAFLKTYFYKWKKISSLRNAKTCRGRTWLYVCPGRFPISYLLTSAVRYHESAFSGKFPGRILRTADKQRRIL